MGTLSLTPGLGGIEGTNKKNSPKQTQNAAT